MNSDTGTPQQVTEFLDRSEGKIGYDVAGTGPLVVLVPGMGAGAAIAISPRG